MTIAVLGIDLGKNSCSLVGLDATGRVVLHRRMRRETVIAFGATLPACVMAMEACFQCLRVVRGRWPNSRSVFWKPLA